METYKTYSVSRSEKAPLVKFIVDGLEAAGCTLVYVPPANSAPFRFVFDDPSGHRIGIIVYAFLANNRKIKGRLDDEHRFQIKYGSDFSQLETVWQDPHELYTTLFVGINPEAGFFVAADPVIHNPTRFSVSIEFKDQNAADILEHSWSTWTRIRKVDEPNATKKRVAVGRDKDGAPLKEVLIGGRAHRLLDLVRLERAALREAPAERQLIAAQLVAPSQSALASLVVDFGLPEERIVQLINSQRMLKMALRGGVAEEHLIDRLRSVPDVDDVRRLDDVGAADVEVVFRGRTLTVECKNVSPNLTASGLAQIDLQRTRASKKDACSRFYKYTDFDVVAACMQPTTQKWDFRFARTPSLDPHKECSGRLSNRVKLDDKRWRAEPLSVFEEIAGT